MYNVVGRCGCGKGVPMRGGVARYRKIPRLDMRMMNCDRAETGC